MRRHGLGEKIRVRAGSNSVESGFEITSDLLGVLKPPAAIFAFNDLVAIGAILAVMESGTLTVPADVGVVGFDDIPLAVHYRPALSTVRQPRLEMGRRAAELLVARMKGQETGEKEVVFQPELLIRSSSRRGMT